mgnify:CR=1 FL=1
MGKLQFCTPLLGRRVFLQGCVLLGVGGAVFGFQAQAAPKPVKSTEFVVVNGWVLPSKYLRNEQA